MPKKYSKNRMWKLYEKLPNELKEAIFSMETANNVFNACIKNEVEDDNISEVARYTGRVLLGTLPSDKFQEVLEKEVGLDKEVAKKVAQEINRFVFYPVKAALEELYKTEITPPTKPITKPKETFKGATAPAPPEKEEKPEQAPPEKDVYREPIE